MIHIYMYVSMCIYVCTCVFVYLRKCVMYVNQIMITQ